MSAAAAVVTIEQCRCGSQLLDNVCPRGHDRVGSECVGYGTLLSRGVCPHGHDDNKTACHKCGTFLSWSRCPHGHPRAKRNLIVVQQGKLLGGQPVQFFVDKNDDILCANCGSRMTLFGCPFQYTHRQLQEQNIVPLQLS